MDWGGVNVRLITSPNYNIVQTYPFLIKLNSLEMRQQYVLEVEKLQYKRSEYKNRAKPFTSLKLEILFFF